jgi:UDP-N-acetylmuramyl pentapeptide synthase
MSLSQSKTTAIVTSFFRALSKSYVQIKKPKVIAVAGSVGKTSTKLFISKILTSEKNVSYMDDSYNNGIGLYLSIFRQKVPARLNSVSSWALILLKSVSYFFKKGPEILVIEYGIDHPGDMDNFIKFIQPDISILTAVCPEHMEFLKTLDIVAKEELSIVKNTKQFSIINNVDISSKYTKDIKEKIYSYGDNNSEASYKITKWETDGSVVSFVINGKVFEDIKIKLISEPLIRQLSGAMLLANLLGLSDKSIKEAIQKIEPAASRMMLLDGVKDSIIIDDTTNFSPLAGIEALKALKRIPGNRKIAILGNMHELGEYNDKGFKDVSEYFKKNIDILILVGELSIEKFGAYAIEYGFIKNKNLFYFDDAVSAGIYTRDNLAEKSDVILVKGPFGGYYLEETVKKLLKDPADYKKLTRQSDFWQIKKSRHFGSSYNK